MIYDAVIVGGGLSGLAAAVRIAAAGGRVVLLERSSNPGGRCYSYVDGKTGDVVDNGQHVLLGAYTHLLHYLRLIGTRGLLKEQPSLVLPFHHPERGHATFRLARLPAPIHLSAGILRYGLLSLRERKDLLRAGMTLRTAPGKGGVTPGDLTVEGWLDLLGQSENSRRCFWDPISVSVMNELPENASALLFAGSIRRAFLGSRADSRMLIPTVGQSELYVGGVRTLLEKGKSSLRLRAAVGSLRVRNGRADGVLLKDGTLVRGKSVVSAVPYHALGAILPADLRDGPEFVRLDSIKSSPIVSVNLWFDMNFMEQDLVGVIGRSTQWLFNRRGIFGERGARTGYVSAVISAARSVVGLPAETLTAMVAEDVRAVFPRARTAEVIHSVVIKEKRATFSPTPGTERIRPGTVTPIRNFYLAGDWTDTGLPATIEGAVQSGFAAAGEILR